MKKRISLFSLALMLLPINLNAESDKYSDVDFKTILSKSEEVINFNKSFDDQVKLGYLGTNLSTKSQDFIQGMQGNSIRHYNVMLGFENRELKCHYKCLVRDFEKCGYMIINANACSFVKEINVFKKTPEECIDTKKDVGKFYPNKPIAYDENKYITCMEEDEKLPSILPDSNEIDSIEVEHEDQHGNEVFNQ